MRDPDGYRIELVERDAEAVVVRACLGPPGGARHMVPARRGGKCRSAHRVEAADYDQADGAPPPLRRRERSRVRANEDRVRHLDDLVCGQAGPRGVIAYPPRGRSPDRCRPSPGLRRPRPGRSCESSGCRPTSPRRPPAWSGRRRPAARPRSSSRCGEGSHRSSWAPPSRSNSGRDSTRRAAAGRAPPGGGSAPRHGRPSRRPASVRPAPRRVGWALTDRNRGEPS